MDDDDDDSHSHGNGIIIHNHKKKHNNFTINISKGGGIGIGVGIILVGGAFLVNFFLNKPSKKPTNKKHLHDHSRSAENTDIGNEKAIGSGVSGEISAHKVFEDGDHTFEGSSNAAEEDHLECNDDDPEFTSFSENSENRGIECDGSVVETDQLSSSAITDPLLHQRTREELANVKLVSCIEVNGGSIDHDDQVKDSKADTAKHGEGDDLLNLEPFEDSKIIEIPEAVHEDNTTINVEINVSEHEENVCRHSDGSVNIKEETNATSEVDQGDEDMINIAIQAREGKGTEGENQQETPCPEGKTAQYDGLIDEVEEAKEGEIRDSNNRLLTTSDGGVLDGNELLEEPKSGEEVETHKFEENEVEFVVQTNTETEGIEDNKAQDLYNAAGEAVVDEEETQLDVHTNAVGEAGETVSSIEHTSKLIEYHVIKEAIEDTNEKEIQDDVHTNAVQEAAEIDSSIEHTRELDKCQVIEEAIEDKEKKEAQHDVNSGSKKSGELMEIQTISDQEDHSHVSHQITTDNILPQENDQNTSSSELSILRELNPASELKIDSKDVGIDLHSIEPVTEKDIIYQETDESSQEHLVNPITEEIIEGGSLALIADNVEESSEGSLVEVKDQIDKLQDNKEHVTLQKTEKEIHYKEIEDDDAISSENIQTANIEKGVSNFFKKYMMTLTEQKNDEKTSLLMRKRGPVVIGTMSALIWPVCYSCLIVVLAMVLYKIQGF